MQFQIIREVHTRGYESYFLLEENGDLIILIFCDGFILLYIHVCMYMFMRLKCKHINVHNI